MYPHTRVGMRSDRTDRTAVRAVRAVGPHCGPKTDRTAVQKRTALRSADRTAVRNGPHGPHGPHCGPKFAKPRTADRSAVRAVRPHGPHGPQIFFGVFFEFFLKKIHIFRIKKGRLIFFFAARFARRLKT